MTRLEAVTRAVGLLLVVIAIALFDWRVGLAALGCALILTTLDDYRRPA